MALGSPATTGGFSDLLSTKWQKVLVSVSKTNPLLYPLAMRVEDMDVVPYLATKISGMGTMPSKPEGQQISFDQPIMGGNFQVTALPFAMGFSVTWEMWRDDLYGPMEDMWADMAKSSRFRQEVQFWAWVNEGFSVATGYDNVTLFNTAHPDLDGTTQANRPSPDVTLSQSAIQAGQLNFRTLNDERGRPYGAEPTRLLIHPFTVPLARELFGSSGKRGTADNDMNALLMEDLTWLPVRYFNRQNDWVLALPKEDTDVVALWRDRPITRHFDDPFTMDADFTMYLRIGLYRGEWRPVYGSSVGT